VRCRVPDRYGRAVSKRKRKVEGFSNVFSFEYVRYTLCMDSFPGKSGVCFFAPFGKFWGLI
jgi:hypothetical protein